MVECGCHAGVRIIAAFIVRALAAIVAGCLVAFSALTPVAAGTTGALTGVVTDAQARPVSAARVSVSSPAQIASATTDGSGSFAFLSLAPDIYTVSVEKNGYEPIAVRNVRILADQTRSLSVVVHPELREIGRVSTQLSDIVRPGTTNDVYSIGPAAAEAAQALGGGANLQNTYSAIAAVPGLFHPPGQVGAGQVLYVRGGDLYEVGYEYDGVPVTRAFDNAPAHTSGNLGQQELQVYTGGGGAGVSSSGTAGFINQVIRTGTYPGFANATLGIGSPPFYHGLTLEVGGASPNRNFSYFAGLSGYNQDYRFFDQHNGAGLLDVVPNIGPLYSTSIIANSRASALGAVYPSCTGNPAVVDPFGGKPPASGVLAGPGCFSAFNPAYGLISNVADRQAVLNVHVGIPHRRDGGKDDVQVLYNSSAQLFQAYASPNDAGPDLLSALLGDPALWPDRFTWPTGVTFGQPAAGLVVVPYFYPSSPQHAFQAPLPLDHRDSGRYDAGIVKVQYQKNIGSNAYARLFAYTFYSDLTESGPMFFAAPGFGGFPQYDYALGTHTRGLEFKLAADVASKHLISATFNDVTATTNRYRNANFLNGPNYAATNLTDGTNCFAYQAGTVSGVDYRAGDRAPCNSALTSGTFGDPTQANAPAVGAAAAAGAAWRVTYAGQQGLLNTVRPTFTSASVSDLFRPSERLTIDAGLRFDRFAYRLADTSGNGREFWFGAARREFCYNPVTIAPVLTPVPANLVAVATPFVGADCPVDASSGIPVQTVHPDGQNGHLLFTNVYDRNEVLTALEPRFGFTYSFNPDTVLRASYGRSAQGPPSALVQYDAKQSNLPALLWQRFWQYGFTSPRHEAEALYSNNVDVSYERHLKGTDMSLKVTPYYRTSANQLYNTADGSFNSGVQRNTGVELEFTKGDFKRNGLSWLLSYTYLHSQERFDDYPGTTKNPVDPFNDAIAQYNALTKAGGGSPCYANSGDVTADAACGPASIRNPYYAMPPQPFFDRRGWYPSGLGSPYLVPNVLAAVVNYRHGPFTLTPTLTFNAGTQYGSPTDVPGLDPRTCTNNSAAIKSSAIAVTDPLKADYTSCGFAATPSGNLFIPNPQTGTFDGFGQFRQPSQLSFNLGLGYEFSSHIKATLTIANLYNGCFGGSRTAWSSAYRPSSAVCGYQTNPVYVSNFYNGTSPNDVRANGVPLNPYFANPFVPAFSDPNIGNFTVPFSAYLQLSVKL